MKFVLSVYFFNFFLDIFSGYGIIYKSGDGA